MREEQLRRWWRARRRKELSEPQRQLIDHWASTALTRMQAYSSPEDCLERNQIHWEITQSSHLVAGVRFRARLDLSARRLTLYAGALDELAGPARERKLVERVILAHEIFHLLCPECPALVHEAAAHWFAAEFTGLPEFPGAWDLPL